MGWALAFQAIANVLHMRWALAFQAIANVLHWWGRVVVDHANRLFRQTGAYL